MVHQQQKVFQKFPLYIENLWQQGQDFHLKFYSDHDMRLHMSKSASFNFLNIVRISFHLRSAQDKEERWNS